MIMENEMFKKQFTSRQLNPDAFKQDVRGHIMASCPLFSALPEEEPVNNVHIAKHDGMINSEMPDGHVIPSVRSSVNNYELHGLLDGNSLFGVPLAKLTDGTSVFPGSLAGVSIPSILPDIARNGVCGRLNTSIMSLVNFRYGASDGIEIFPQKEDMDLDEQVKSRLNCNEILGHDALSRSSICNVRPSYHVEGSSDAGWFLNDPFSCNITAHKLSPSLASVRHPIDGFPNSHDQSSDVSYSGITKARCKESSYLQAYPYFSHTIDDVEIGSRQTDLDDMELSDYVSFRPVPFPLILLGSKYLHMTQQVLAEDARSALEDQDAGDHQVVDMDRNEACISHASRCSVVGGVPSSQMATRMASFDYNSRTKKAELLSMLQMIDRRYDRCVTQLQGVMKAFHDATETGYRKKNAWFTPLRTISALYRDLRDHLTSEILSSGQCLSGERMMIKKGTFGSSFIRKQWALQQMRRNELQCWRPPRGLPEKSVSVLRAWMFQNFLHPYPNNTEKCLLAIKSGLTRGQVSNWFINARVRLWKPMIEEMHREFNNKPRQEGAMENHRSQIKIGAQTILKN